MADDWAVGDLALCVRTEEPCSCGKVFTHSGSHYVVTFFGPDEDQDDDLILAFEEVGFGDHHCGVIWHYGFDPTRFRKIRPLTDEERDSFLADLDAPVSPAAPSRSHAGDRPNDDASNHSPAAPLSASLPESVSAPNRDALSGFSDLRFHEARNV